MSHNIICTITDNDKKNLSQTRHTSSVESDFLYIISKSLKEKKTVSHPV